MSKEVTLTKGEIALIEEMIEDFSINHEGNIDDFQSEIESLTEKIKD